MTIRGVGERKMDETLTKFRPIRAEREAKEARERASEKAIAESFKLHRGEDGRLMR
jgi:hypothetical protein